MTISTTYTPQVSAGDGSTTDFTIPFPFYGASSVVVQLLDATTGIPLVPAPVLNGGGDNDYVILSTPDPDTGISPNGTVRFNVAPTSDMKPWRGRATPDAQGKEFPTNGRFPAKANEGALDIRTLRSQEAAEDTAHTLRVVGTSDAWPPLSVEKGKIFATDPDTGLPVYSTRTLEEIEAAPDATAAAAAAEAAAAVATGVQPVDLANPIIVTSGTITLGVAPNLLNKAYLCAPDTGVEIDLVFPPTASVLGQKIVVKVQEGSKGTVRLKSTVGQATSVILGWPTDGYLMVAGECATPVAQAGGWGLWDAVRCPLFGRFHRSAGLGNIALPNTDAWQEVTVDTIDSGALGTQYGPGALLLVSNRVKILRRGKYRLQGKLFFSDASPPDNYQGTFVQGSSELMQVPPVNFPGAGVYQALMAVNYETIFNEGDNVPLYARSGLSKAGTLSSSSGEFLARISVMEIP